MTAIDPKLEILGERVNRLEESSKRHIQTLERLIQREQKGKSEG